MHLMGAHRRHLANTIKIHTRRRCVLYQITLTTRFAHLLILNGIGQY